MLNTPRTGLDPEGYSITDATTDLPGLFLTKDSAEDYLKEKTEGARKRYAIVSRGVRVHKWNIDIWILVPKTWSRDTAEPL